MSDEFKVDTVEKAAAVMRKYRVLAQRRAQNEALAVAERARIDAWLERANEPIEGRMEFYGAHLEAWAMMERANGRKSVDLPDGVLKSRQTSPGLEVDKAVFVEWATDGKRDDLLRVSFAPNMTAIKESFLADGPDVIDPASGEVVPGLSPVAGRVSVTIAPDMDAIDLEGIEGIDEDDE